MNLSFRTRIRKLSNAGGGGGGGGTPGGANGQIQYNNGGSFGGLASTGTGAVARAVDPAFTGTPTAPTAAAATNTTQLATTAFVQQEISGIVQVLAGEVANFAALPAAASHSGDNYLVRQSQGVYFVNRKPAGIYTSDGADWNYDGDATEAYFQDTLAWSNITSKPDFAALYMALVAPGSTGNVLTSNGTVWTSAAPAGGGGGVSLGKIVALNQTSGLI